MSRTFHQISTVRSDSEDNLDLTLRRCVTDLSDCVNEMLPLLQKIIASDYVYSITAHIFAQFQRVFVSSSRKALARTSNTAGREDMIALSLARLLNSLNILRSRGCRRPVPPAGTRRNFMSNHGRNARLSVSCAAQMSALKRKGELPLTGSFSLW
jgi:hypothetical protein